MPVMLCFERPPAQAAMISGDGEWCHRAMAAEWLAEALGFVVPEFGFEDLPQHEHPLMPTQLRRVIAMPERPDVIAWVGWTATISGELHRVVGPDPAQPGKAIVAVGDRQFSTGVDMLRRYFSPPNRVA